MTTKWMGEHITNMRVQRGFSREQLAARAGWSGKSLVGHLEAAVRLFNTDHVAALLPALGRSEHVAHYQRLVTEAAAKGEWWRELLPKEKDTRKRLRGLELFLSFEASAITIRHYASYAVPELLRTPPYTDAVLRATEPSWAELRCALQPGRQAILGGTEPTEIQVVLDEHVLRRVAGGAEVMRAQLAHLAEHAVRPNVTLQILPTEAGIPAAEGGFSLMDMPAELDGHPGAACLESAVDWLCYERPDELRQFRRYWERLREQALPPERTPELLQRAARELVA
ncbi:helix-turn-helix domain-containing protein [Qaidamihabitans albus]|uniref:helix-turn-helix domain-containing protein n=1 Tax=Qaidamihabitans albus TaxID=2795733 RepID=UPI001B3571C8|nr:helix-turn-helix transcriptional regulator [Qaidamihabitans albus]